VHILIVNTSTNTCT